MGTGTFNTANNKVISRSEIDSTCKNELKSSWLEEKYYQ